MKQLFLFNQLSSKVCFVKSLCVLDVCISFCMEYSRNCRICLYKTVSLSYFLFISACKTTKLLNKYELAIKLCSFSRNNLDPRGCKGVKQNRWTRVNLSSNYIYIFTICMIYLDDYVPYKAFVEKRPILSLMSWKVYMRYVLSCIGKYILVQGVKETCNIVE